MSTLIQQLNDEMADVIDHVKASLVQVSNGGESHGAGVIISADGLILTNAHVVRQRQVQVRLPNAEIVSADLLAHDTDRDLALLKVTAADLSYMPISDSTHLDAGQWVMAVGHPWGVSGAVTSGVLIDRTERASHDAGREWLAAALHLRPGNSGGPLVDVQGRLLGINTVMAGPEVGLAIPAEVIRAFLSEVEAHQATQSKPDSAADKPQYV